MICNSHALRHLQRMAEHQDIHRDGQGFSLHRLSEAFKIGGTYHKPCDTIEPYLIDKGGGKWRPNPNKPEDSRYIGSRGEIKTIYKNGYRIDTKIGSDGRAVEERHYTDHHRPDKHTNPHDHLIKWDNPSEHPDPQSPINYPCEAPEFKKFGGLSFVKNTIISANTPDQNRFTTISDFKDCMRWGGEVEFVWKGVHYGVFARLKRADSSSEQILISQICVENCQDTEKWCNTTDEVLDYMVGSDRLRDVITRVTVLDRSI